MLKKLYYFILHFKECPDEDLEYFNRKTKAICKKCGRKYDVLHRN